MGDDKGALVPWGKVVDSEAFRKSLGDASCCSARAVCRALFSAVRARSAWLSRFGGMPSLCLCRRLFVTDTFETREHCETLALPESELSESSVEVVLDGCG